MFRSLTRPSGRHSIFTLLVIYLAGALWTARHADASAHITQPFSGIAYIHRVQNKPRPLSIHILDIDLRDPAIRFLVTPPNGDQPAQTTPQTTPAFVTQVGAQAGINANFFSYHKGHTNNLGAAASDGEVYSSFNPRWPTLNLSADNLATIVTKLSPEHPIRFHNAVSGSDRIVANGQNVARRHDNGDPGHLNPRTVAGITADRHLLLMVIDGRSKTSRGTVNRESADLLIAYGAVEGINLDGGGSSTLALRQNGGTRVMNRPSDGHPRRVGTNLAIFAAETTQARNLFVYNDFYAGDQGTFRHAPAYSGSTHGILDRSTNQAIQSNDAVSRGWFDRLTIKDDPSVSITKDRPEGGWFVRLISGLKAEPAENIARPATGFIGFWARTQSRDVKASIALDHLDNTPAGRGRPQFLIPDGQWHLYQWNLERADQWEAWMDQNPTATPGETFTLDSLQFFGPDEDAVIDIDRIGHNALGSLRGPVR